MTNCKGCLIGMMGDEGKNLVPENIIIRMKGDWVLNHCSGLRNNYLGHLILQPKEHRMDMDELEGKEVSDLGNNLHMGTKLLKEYWAQKFTWDELQRVYVVYFWESEFAKTFAGEWHMHIHLFPRTKVMVGGYEPTQVAAWKLPELIDKAIFPSEYRMRKDNVKELMEYLDKEISTQKC